MKNLMKKFFLFLTLAVAACGFAACSDDDDNGGDEANYEELIVGSWEVYKEYWYDEDGWDYQFGEGIFQMNITFNANGTYVSYGAEWYQGEKSTWSDRGNYVLSGKRILMFEDEYNWECEIVKLNNSELVLKCYDDDVVYDRYMHRK